MKIEYQTGFAIDKPVDAVVNSANGFLLLGKSGAGRIRDVADKLNIFNWVEYGCYLLSLPKKTRMWFVNAYKNHNWKLSKAQLSSMRLLLENNKQPFLLGSVVMDKDKINGKTVIHAVGMSYDLDKNKERIPATEDSVNECMKNVIKIISVLGVDSIAIPVMCARKGYGLSPEKSLKIIESSLKEISDSKLKVTICFDNEETERYLQQINA